MLTVQHLAKSFGIEPVLQDISFTVNRGERLGLVGPNGCGKTTLLRLIAGLDLPDQGSLLFDPPNLSLGYLAQGFPVKTAGPSPVIDREPDTLRIYLNRMEGDLPGLAARLEELAGILAREPGQTGLLQEYDATLAQLASASENAGRGPSVLAALGLGHLPLDLPVANLSGGQKTRLALAGILLTSPQLLLLDEPTNHLDLEMLTWLEDWLLAFRGAALIVSHDRAFLDGVATGILELEPATHTMHAYPGNYTAYLERKLAEQEQQWQNYTDQQEEIAHLQSSAAHLRGVAKFRRGGKGDSGDKFARGFFGNRSAGTVRRAKQLEKRLEVLLTGERIEKPKQSWQMKLDFSDAPAGVLSSSRDVLALDNVAIGFGEMALVEAIQLHVRHGARIALIGPNGAGKTTLLRTIAGQIPPLKGQVRLGSSIRLGFMGQEQEDLDLGLDALETVRRLAPLGETEARAFLHRYLFSGDEVFLPVGSLSFGERARLSLACLVAQGCNFLLLDEPINHLDIPSRAHFEAALAEFEGTVLAVVHDRFFISGFATEIWEVTQGRIERTSMDF